MEKKMEIKISDVTRDDISISYAMHKGEILAVTVKVGLPGNPAT